MPAAEPAGLEGRTLGKYQVLRKLGEGHMATVYVAQDPFIDRLVAIKVAHADAETGQDPALIKRLFFNEAQTAGMLRHPNITAIFDAGVDQDVYYIVMEYVVGGQTLEQFTRADTLLPLPEVATVLYQSALALDYAHRRGIVHRDIKPRNILLTPSGEVKLSDFGVAVVQSSALPGTPRHAGSPLYMSPEQLQNEGLTGQSDLFSLGIIAYELLTGHHPFAGADLEESNRRTLTMKPLAMTEFRSDLPDIFQRIVERALAKAVYYRYKTGADLAGDLALTFDFLRRSPQQVPPPEKFARLRALRFFADFEEPELWEIVNAADWLEPAADSEIVREGDLEASFYVLVEGSVAVTKSGSEIVRLGPGDCFGEMALVSGRRRSASIRTMSTTHIIRLRSSIVDRMSVNAQLCFQRNFLAALVERLESTTGNLAAQNAGSPMAAGD